MRRILLLTLAALTIIFLVVGCGVKAPTTSQDNPRLEQDSKFEDLGTATDTGK